MPTPARNEIEKESARLSPEAQLSLLERLKRQAHVSQLVQHDPWEDQLSAMTADPQIRREIDCFNADTRVTESDGLQGD
jgi:hypothetical protein